LSVVGLGGGDLPGDPALDGLAARTSYRSLPRRTRRRLLAWALLRPAATAAGLTLLYYGLPLDKGWTRESVVGFAAGLVALVMLVAWQARAIAKARYPRLRGIEALVSTLVFFLFLFALSYFAIGTSQPEAFSESLSRTDSLYFTVTVFATVGFGDIVARSEGARLLVTVQMLAGLALVGLGVRVLLSAIQSGVRRAQDPSD
jgi:hypothetical protein